jgi:hypothetical protein
LFVSVLVASCQQEDKGSSVQANSMSNSSSRQESFTVKNALKFSKYRKSSLNGAVPPSLICEQTTIVFINRYCGRQNEGDSLEFIVDSVSQSSASRSECARKGQILNASVASLSDEPNALKESISGLKCAEGSVSSVPNSTEDWTTNISDRISSADGVQGGTEDWTTNISDRISNKKGPETGTEDWTTNISDR